MKEFEAWLESNEVWLLWVYRLAVLALLLSATHRLDRIYDTMPDLRTLEQDVDRIQRDAAKIKEKVDPERLVPPSPPLPNSLPWPKLPPSR